MVGTGDFSANYGSVYYSLRPCQLARRRKTSLILKVGPLAESSPCRDAAPTLCPGDEVLPGGAPRTQQGRAQPAGQVPSCASTMATRKVLVLVERCSRGANQRMNPDFAESAPKPADFADFWPIFHADFV